MYKVTFKKHNLEPDIADGLLIDETIQEDFPLEKAEIDDSFLDKKFREGFEIAIISENEEIIFEIYNR